MPKSSFPRTHSPFLAWLSCALLAVLLLTTAFPAAGQPNSPYPYYLPVVLRQLTVIPTPVLKWQQGGCNGGWCDTGWYSSPAIGDVNGDGKNEVIASGYDVWTLNGDTGTLIHSADAPGGGRTWPGIGYADIDKDGTKEIVTANGSGYVTVYRPDLTVKWQQRPTTSELRGMLIAELDGDGSTLEVVVSAANGNKLNTWVYNSGGSVRSGWPQLNNSNSYAAGVYNANAAAANLDPADNRLELILPTDVHYIMGYKPDGTLMAANTTVYPSRPYWGKVGVYEDPAVEIRGWGECTPGAGQAENYRPNFAGSPAVIADLNGDGVREVVVAGNVHDCSTDPYTDKYIGPYIFNEDRTRFNSGGYNWTTVPQNTGAPLTEDYNIIENAQPNPVVADLDNDGKKEILYPSYDGKLHAFWLDKTEHGSWPYSVYTTAGDYRFASEPVVADLDGDGKAEVIFTSWVKTNSSQLGKLHILSYDGRPIKEINLPAAPHHTWNGALPAPTLGFIGSDPNLSIVVNTIHDGVVVYDLPGITSANIQWGTGRGSYLRDGAR